MTSANGRLLASFHWLTKLDIVALNAIAFLAPSMAHPHDLLRPELNTWYERLKNKAGERCCDTGDGQHVEAEWDMTNGRYHLLKHPHRPTEPGQWFDVPDDVIIRQPNLGGIAMVWWYPSYKRPRWKDDSYISLLHSGTTAG